MKARYTVFGLLAIVLLVLSACAAPTPQVVEKVVTQVVKEQVKVVETQVVEVPKEVKVVETQVVEKVVEKIVEATPAPDVMAGMKGKKIAAVFSGPVNDAGWTTSAYKGLVHLRDAYGMDIAYTENVTAADAEQVFRDYAKAGYDIVFGHGFEWAEAIEKVAKEFPNTKFMQTNGSAANVPNLYTVTNSAGEGGYFVGMIACSITKTGKVAYVAGSQFPLLDHHIKMSHQACQDLGKDKVEIIESYVGGWADPAKAKELAAADIENGVDVLILEADAGDQGTIEAAKEAFEKGNKNLRVISWVKDKNYLAPDIVIGGWKEDIVRNMEYTVQKMAAGDPGGHFAIGLKENAVGLEPFYGLVPAEVEKQVTDALQKYLADPSSLPTLQVRTDL
jgi:basic membrane protein A and related proteins